ncbi:MAG: hypothetical protein JXB00_09310 [Bacteroidales bacterium]|nr:hypothetical protein [Bacteroidales bacterium]
MGLFKKKSKYTDKQKVYIALIDTSNRLLDSDKEFLNTIDKSDKDFNKVDIESNLLIHRLERLILCLSTLPLHIKKLNLDNTYIDYCYNHLVTDFSKDFIKNILISRNLSIDSYILERHKVYSDEIHLILTMDNPHPGRILYYLFNPTCEIENSSVLIDNNLRKDMISSIFGYGYFFDVIIKHILELLPETIKICLKEL